MTDEDSSLSPSSETRKVKVCAVCGDKALGFNFGAMTCESCKAFFRRNAVSKKELKCPFDGSCHVTQVTRRFCQRCRLRKCIEVGMKKESILSASEKLDKRRKIEENRQKRMPVEAENGTGEPFPGAQQPNQEGTWSKESNPFPLSTSCDAINSAVSVAIKAEFHAVSSPSVVGQSPTTQYVFSGSSKKLNKEEVARIQELYDASRSLVEPLEYDREDHVIATEGPNNLISVMNLTDVAVKRIIRMARSITSFVSMCQEDKIALLKGGCTELMILRSIINYNPEKNSWSLPTMDKKELRLDVLKQANHYGVQLYEEHKLFVQSFEDRWRSDESVMLLLSAIALFTPERANVVHSDVIKLDLIGKLHDLHRLNESHIQLFLEVDPQRVEPLLIEIFDLKPGARC